MVIWDNEKYLKLSIERNIRLDEIEKIILKKEYIEIIKNKNYPNQFTFIILYNNYIHAVPFLMDSNKNIIIKTVFPSRKLNKLYANKKNKKN